MLTTKLRMFLILISFSAAMLASGCGPTYPNCDTDEHCEEQGERCVANLCKECAGDNDCASKDICGMCGPENACMPRPGCCQSDLDCPGGRCWRVSGTQYGECGGRCRTEGSPEDCNSGEVCRSGQCVPDNSCTDNSQCSPGKACIEGYCVNHATWKQRTTTSLSLPCAKTHVRLFKPTPSAL
jgi:peptidoglycan-associated lipoprotein